MLKIYQKPFFSVLIVFAIIFSITSSASALNSDETYFSNYEVDYYLTREENGISKLRVIEEFTAEFPEENIAHGILRTIPYTNQGGKNLTTASDQTLDVKIYRNGTEEPYNLTKEVTNDGSYFLLQIGSSGDYVQGQQIYRLEYEFGRVITDYETYQELYWDTNGTGWSQSFRQITARVHIDQPEVLATLKEDSWCYVGKQGSNNQTRCKIQKLVDGVEFSAENLSAKENLTFVISFLPDTFAVPPLEKDYTAVWLAIIMLLVWILAAIITIIIRKVCDKKHQYLKKQKVSPQYLPPKDLTVAESAYLHPEKQKGDARVATLTELAVTHKIEIIHSGENAKKNWKIHIKSLELQTWQEAVLHLLAGDSRIFKIDEEFEVKKRRSAKKLGYVVRNFEYDVEEKLEDKGYLVSRSLKKRYLNNFLISIVAFILLFAVMPYVIRLASIFPESTSYRPVVGGFILEFLVIISPVFILITIVNIAKRPSLYERYSERGLDMINYLNGLKLYIKMAEADRLQFLQSVKGADTSHDGIVKLYEKLLPYAVLFKQEKSWENLLSKYYKLADTTTRPKWYVTAGKTFDDNLFTSSLSDLYKTTSANYHSAYTYHSRTNIFSGFFSGGDGGSSSDFSDSSSSSSSSGSDGGGYSGGGGGGGGGGVW